MAETAWLTPGASIPSLSQIDVDLFNQWHPSVRAEWQQEATRDAKSKNYLSQIGGTNYDGYLQWWLQNHANGTGLGVPLLGTPVAPPPVNPPTVVPPPQTNGNENGLQDLINQLLGGFNQQMRDAEAASAARTQARNAVESFFGNPASKFSSDIFGDTDDNFLNEQYNTNLTMLDRAKARGQVNDQGYQAGLGKLNTFKTGASAKLNQTINDILSGYRTKYGDLKKEALGAAESTSPSMPFSIDAFKTRAEQLAAEAAANAPGTFINQMGGQNLFDFGLIRNAAGQAQGALNLRNLDVMDALAKRKAVAAVGRGIGSQGTF